MLTPINQALFPYLSKLYKKDINIFFKKVATLSKLFFLISIGVYVVSFLFKDFLIYIITGSYNKEISFLLGIFLLRIITYQLAPLFSNVLIIMKKNKDYMKVMNLTVLLNFLVVPPSIYLWELQGLVISFISVIFIHVLLLLKKYKAVGS
jgi:PST family polysaccharide transporter